MKLVQTRNFQQTSLPVDTGRKLNTHKTFRKHTGRLLNVLCTFNSRPVSTGLIRITPKEQNEIARRGNKKA